MAKERKERRKIHYSVGNGTSYQVRKFRNEAHNFSSKTKIKIKRKSVFYLALKDI